MEVEKTLEVETVQEPLEDESREEDHPDDEDIEEPSGQKFDFGPKAINLRFGQKGQDQMMFSEPKEPEDLADFEMRTLYQEGEEGEKIIISYHMDLKQMEIDGIKNIGDPKVILKDTEEIEKIFLLGENLKRREAQQEELEVDLNNVKLEDYTYRDENGVKVENWENCGNCVKIDNRKLLRRYFFYYRFLEFAKKRDAEREEIKRKEDKEIEERTGGKVINPIKIETTIELVNKTH